MKRLLCLWVLLFPVLSFACTPDYVKYTNGTVRAMAPSQTSTAAYMDIENTSDNPITIVSVSSPDAPKVMLHKSVANPDGTVSMEHVHRLVLDPNSTTHLAPGGMHVMLEGLKAPLTKDDQITLVFTYEDKSTSTVKSIPVTAVTTQ